MTGVNWTLAGLSAFTGICAGVAAVYAGRARKAAEAAEHCVMLVTGHSLRWHLGNFASEAADLRAKQGLADAVIALHRKRETMGDGQADAPETPRTGG